MLRQIKQTQDTMRISIERHMERKCQVLVNSENILNPQQLITSKNRSISLKVSKLQICFVLNVFNDKMWQIGNKAVINNRILLLQGVEKM